MMFMLLLFMSCFIVAIAYRADADASTTSGQIFLETSFMPTTWTFGVGMQTAESKDRANLNLARYLLRFSDGGVGGGALPPTPLPEKVALGIFPRGIP